MIENKLVLKNINLKSKMLFEVHYSIVSCFPMITTMTAKIFQLKHLN